MHAMVLGIAGYSLLLSSCVALAYLLRIGCLKDVIRSPLQIFSTSDTLISAFTSIILLVNQSLSSFDFVQESPMADLSKTTGRQLLSHHGDKEYHQNRTCMRMDIRETDGSAPNCSFQRVLMHYAIFLVPFANAFVSLLIYSMQCSSGMTCITKKCSKITKTLKDLEIGGTRDQDSASSSRKRNLRSQKDTDEICQDPEAGMLNEKKTENISAISIEGHFLGSLKKNLKFTGFGLTTQWLIPVLAMVILYSSKSQDMNDVRESSEMDCIFKVNFPLESCLKIGPIQSEEPMNQKKNYGQSPGYSGVEDPDTFRVFHPDSKEIDDVVSRVRNLVQSALNKTCYNGSKLNDRRDFKPWNITQYFMQQVKSYGVEVLEKLSNRSQGNSGSDNCISINGNDSNSEDKEVFGDVDFDLSQDIVQTLELTPKLGETEPSNSDFVKVTTDIDTVTENIGMTNPTEANVHEVTTENEQVIIEAETGIKEFNDEIEAEIIKHIRDVVGQVETKKKETGNQQEAYNKKSNSGLLEERSRINRTQTSLLGLEGSRAREDKKTHENVFFNLKGNKQSQVSNNKYPDCFLSAKFLRIHLLIFLFSVYFLPVLISAVLQTRAVYTCKNIYDKIESANQKRFPDPFVVGQLSVSSETVINENLPKSGWFSDNIDGVKTNVKESSSGRHNDTERPEIDSRFYEDRKTGYKNVLEEMRSMQMLFGILKKSLLLSMLMWTPAFLEILSKVFLCTSSPVWLANGLYLLGISFGIVKNFLNVSIAKIDKSMSDQVHGKDNSVHPSV